MKQVIFNIKTCVAHALDETDDGKSKLARKANNFFGYNSIDKTTVKSGENFAKKHGWNTRESGLWSAIQRLYKSTQCTLYAMRWNHLTREHISMHRTLRGHMHNEFIKYDRMLNILYKEIFNKNPTASLKNVEEAWVKFKESDCEYMARAVNKGIFYSFIRKACWTGKTKVRIADLQRDNYHNGWFHKKGW